MTTTPDSNPPTISPQPPADPDQRLLDLRARIADVIGAHLPVESDARLGDLGVTSLRMAVLLAGVWCDWGVLLSLTDLEPNSTAETIAALIDEQRAAR